MRLTLLFWIICMLSMACSTIKTSQVEARWYLGPKAPSDLVIHANGFEKIESPKKERESVLHVLAKNVSGKQLANQTLFVIAGRDKKMCEVISRRSISTWLPAKVIASEADYNGLIPVGIALCKEDTCAANVTRCKCEESRCNFVLFKSGLPGTLHPDILRKAKEPDT
jgi:hypothetical protein